MTSTLAPPTWREVPVLPEAAPQSGTWWKRWAFAPLLSAFGPVTRTLWMIDVRANATLVAGVIVGASVLCGFAGERRWPLRALIALGGGAALVGTQGNEIAVWGWLGLLLADWVVRQWRPTPWLPRATSAALPPVTLLVGLAAWRSWTSRPGLVPLSLTTIAIAVTAVGALSRGRSDRVIAQLGHSVGALVSRVLFSLLAIPLVLLPWAAARLVRVDSLAIASRAQSGWTRRGVENLQPGRIWAPDALLFTSTTWMRWARVRFSLALTVLTALVATLAVMGVAAFPSRDQPATTAKELGIYDVPAAFAHDDWYQVYMAEMTWLTSTQIGWYPLRSPRLADVRSRYININDGVRRSWRPPACKCRRVSVWMYGGSTAFGIGQRDGHTIASEIARLAWEDGYAVDIKNRGSLGEMHWEEANRFSWDVTVEKQPDLVVFYDGVNELWSAMAMRAAGLGDIPAPLEPTLEELWSQVRDDDPSDMPPRPPDVELTGRQPAVKPDSQSPNDVAQLAVSRYDRSRAMSRATAAHYGVPIEWFWQPSGLTRDPIPSEQGAVASENSFNLNSHRATEAAVPPGVNDVTDALDGNTEPLFSDDVHHNEQGAQLIAEAMYPSIRDHVAATSKER